MAGIDALLEPIAGDNPAGANLRYDPVYDKIKEARREDPFTDPPVRADWRAVVELTGQALAKRSKDLQLAAWWTEGMLRRDGIPGLRQGLELLNALLEKFWDHVHPEMDDGDVEMRAGPLAWIGSYLDVGVRLAPIDAGGNSYADHVASRAIPTENEGEKDSEKQKARTDAMAEGKVAPEVIEKGFAATPKAWLKQLLADVDASGSAAEALEKTGDQRLGDAAPGYQKLREALRDFRSVAVQLLTRKLELDPDPPDAEPVDLEGPGEGAAGGAISIEPRTRDDAAKRIAAIAKFLRKDSATDPAPYLMLRGFRWGELRAGGPNPDPRLLAAPPTEVRTRLKGLLLDGRWPDLLEAAEDVMATPFGRGWLDLQRYALTACDALGGEFAQVTVAIRGALRTLLRDIPGLPDSTLMDDLPTANGETRGWLRDQGILPGTGSAEEESEPEPTPAMTDSIDRMLPRMGATNPQRAIELLMRAASQEKSERARFMRRSEAARIMVDSGMENVAMPILRDLLTQIDTHQLEDWESGETVAQPLGLLYRCLDKAGDDPSERDTIYLRVCRLDPVQAMRFVGSSRNDEQPGE